MNNRAPFETYMKEYQCHKKVKALKIIGISLDGQLSFEGTEVKRFMSEQWLKKFNPEVGGYLVRYEDGYTSFSPAKAFEDGYELIDK